MCTINWERKYLGCMLGKELCILWAADGVALPLPLLATKSV